MACPVYLYSGFLVGSAPIVQLLNMIYWPHASIRDKSCLRGHGTHWQLQRSEQSSLVPYSACPARSLVVTVGNQLAAGEAVSGDE